MVVKKMSDNFLYCLITLFPSFFLLHSAARTGSPVNSKQTEKKFGLVWSQLRNLAVNPFVILNGIQGLVKIYRTKELQETTRLIN